MLNGIGVSGVLLLLIIALLLFGPNKLPELGRAFGRTLREFKAGARDIMGDEEETKPARKEVQSVDVNQAPAASAPQPAASTEQQRRLPE